VTIERGSIDDAMRARAQAFVAGKVGLPAVYDQRRRYCWLRPPIREFTPGSGSKPL
jgi:hypothetical protein